MAAYLTIGTPTVHRAVMLGAELLLLTVLLGFAIYDIRHKRVPNKALAICLPIFLLTPILPLLPVQLELDFWCKVAPVLVSGILGTITGFGILLTAALLSKGGAGVGGGDIKLMALLGFAYGPYRSLVVLLIASMLCMIVALFYKTKAQPPSALPFVPFLVAGSIATTLILI